MHLGGNGDLEEFASWSDGRGPDICLVDMGTDPTNGAAIARKIHSSAPDVAIFAVSAHAQPEAIIEAMRNGCSEFLVKPINEQELLKGFARKGNRKSASKKVHHSQVFAFMGAKGGCGVTTLATQLGAALASSFSRKVLLVDLHPDLGDAALYLGLTKHLYSSLELIENADRLDSEFLQGFLAHHSSGLDLIPAPEGGQSPWSAGPDELTRVLDFLRRSYDFILLDVPLGLNQRSLDLAHYADGVFLVTVPEVSALRNVVRQTDYFLQGLAEEKIRVVLNRYHKRGPLTDSEIEKAIRREIFWKVPNQYAQVVKTISGGDPMAVLSSSDVMRSINDWAASLAGRRDDRKKQDSRGFFGFLAR